MYRTETFHIVQEIDFERSGQKRCWNAKVDWQIEVNSGTVVTDKGSFVDVTATVEYRDVLSFALIDEDGNEFANSEGSNLPDYVPYVLTAIKADIDYMSWMGIKDWKELAIQEAIHKYREQIGDAATEGKVVIR